MALSGGQPVAVCDLTSDAAGVSWGADDSIVFAERGNGLFRVTASGGKPEHVAAPDDKQSELEYFSPHVLPGAKGVLFTILPAGGGSIGAGRSQIDPATFGPSRWRGGRYA